MTLNNIYSPYIHKYFPNDVYYNLGIASLRFPYTTSLTEICCNKYPIKTVMINSQVIDFLLDENQTLPSIHLLKTLDNKQLYNISRLFFYNDNADEIAVNYLYDGSQLPQPQWNNKDKSSIRKSNNLAFYQGIGNTYNLKVSYKALHSLCHFLNQKKIHLIFSISPISPYYLTNENDSVFYKNFVDSCSTILQQYNYQLYHFDNQKYGIEDFGDGHHLSNPGSKAFTKELIQCYKETI